MADSPNSSPSPPQSPQSPTKALSRQESVASPIIRAIIESPSIFGHPYAADDDLNEIELSNEQCNQLILSPTFSTPLSFDSRIDETERLFTNERSVHQIPIYIETLTGTTFEMQIMSQETIYAVKFKLQLEEGIPVSQQHLLWQGEELKDEFTLEEYGIGFGAILRLVLGMRGGPLSESPLSTANRKETASSSQQECNSTNVESQPLTVLIFQNGNHIKLLTIGTGNTTASLSTAGFNTAGSSFETTVGTSSMQQPHENVSRSGTAKSARKKKAKIDRDIENEAMRLKMDELRKKMKS
ncbi:AN1-type zinc finger protein 4-like protein, partial [Leptotrombidium deliense]